MSGTGDKAGLGESLFGCINSPNHLYQWRGRWCLWISSLGRWRSDMSQSQNFRVWTWVQERVLPSWMSCHSPKQSTVSLVHCSKRLEINSKSCSSGIRMIDGQDVISTVNDSLYEWLLAHTVVHITTKSECLNVLSKPQTVGLVHCSKNASMQSITCFSSCKWRWMNGFWCNFLL